MRFLVLFFVCSRLLWASDSPVRYEFQYRVKLTLPHEGARVRLWVPYPTQNAFQTIEKASVTSPLRWELKREKQYGNQMVYFEGVSKKKELDISLNYDVTRRPSHGILPAEVKKESPDDPSHFIKEDPRIPLVQLIRNIAAQETKKSQTDKEKLRAIYDYVVRTMSYDKSGVGWGKGDPIWACSTKRGNCTDFHSLFIALSRSVGIPSRFIIGFPVPEGTTESEIPGYHCWAEAYAKGVGWNPMDATEGKKSGNPELYFGRLPPNRIQFALGRDLVLEPPQHGEPLNFFVYPYAEVEGKVLEAIQKQFHVKRI